MGALVQDRKGGRKRRRLMNEINVTPMVDVMLVLLIIFMVTSPMLVAGIEVDLPQTDSAPVSASTAPLVISLNKNDELYITETLVDKISLVSRLKSITKEKMDTRIFIKGDKSISYGKIVEIMSLVQNAGFTKAALITDIKK